jgi:hypothetical protein
MKDSRGDAQSVIFGCWSRRGKLSGEAHEIAAGKAGCIKIKGPISATTMDARDEQL